MKNKEWILQLYRLRRLSGNPTIWELWKRSEYDNWSRLDFFYTKKNEAMLKCAMFGIVEDDVQEDSSIDDKCKRKKQ